MIIDSKGKLFGKISIVDIVVIIFVVLVIFGIYQRFNGDAAQDIKTGIKLRYEVEIKNIRMLSVETLQKKGTIYDSTQKVPIGEIIDVQYKPYEVLVTKSDGELATTIMPNKYVCYVTIETDGKISTTGYLNPINQILRVPNQQTIMTKWISAVGTIKSINVVE